MFLLYIVCKPSKDLSCNVHGSKCVEDKCQCKPGYTGDLCQYCESTIKRHCLVTNRVIEGEVNTKTGGGVICSCE